MTSPDRWAQMNSNPEPDPASAIELPETGWGSLIAWIAGPAWVHPYRRRELPQVRQTSVDGSGTVISATDRSADDQAVIDDDIAEFLQDAGVPRPPRMTRWSLRRPAGLRDEDFWAHLHSSMDRQCPSARHPLEIHRCVAPILLELLASGPADPVRAKA